jgi:hypothetical protein
VMRIAAAEQSHQKAGVNEPISGHIP